MKGSEALHRAITQQEIAVIEWLLQHGEPGSDRFFAQLETLTVVSRCTCGCPTIYFELENNQASRKGEHLISDQLGTVDGQDVGVMLSDLNGRLSSLEVYSCAGADKPIDLPKLENLYTFEEASKRHVRALKRPRQSLLLHRNHDQESGDPSLLSYLTLRSISVFVFPRDQAMT